MSWALFCQIEVIVLTLGLVIAFVLSSRQNMKDNSFFKRVAAVGKAFETISKNLPEKVRNQATYSDIFRSKKNDE